MTARTRLPHVQPAVLTTAEAASYVGLGIVEFRAAVRAREIAVIADRGHWRFRAADLDAYLEHTRQPAAWESATAKRSGRSLVSLPTTGTNPLDGLPWSKAL